jgi:hypothetical protein
VKTVVFVLSIFVVVLVFCWAAGLVEFTYLNVVPNEPLKHPCKVQIIDGTNMLLESGEMISFWPRYSSERSNEEAYSDISNQVCRSGFQIDIETNRTGNLDIFVRRHRKFRDTIPPFVIPLVRKTVEKERREVVASGAYVRTGSKPNDATIGIQQNRLETNRTSSTVAPE